MRIYIKYFQKTNDNSYLKGTSIIKKALAQEKLSQFLTSMLKNL